MRWAGCCVPLHSSRSRFGRHRGSARHAVLEHCTEVPRYLGVEQIRIWSQKNAWFDLSGRSDCRGPGNPLILWSALMQRPEVSVTETTSSVTEGAIPTPGG